MVDFAASNFIRDDKAREGGGGGVGATPFFLLVGI
jgi:hypothetical protein